MIENKALVLDLVAWVAKEPRAYDLVMQGWRTSCPRLTIWEDAVDHGFLETQDDGERGSIVKVTEAGRTFLRDEGR